MAIFYRPPADIDDFSRRPALESTLRQRWHDKIGADVAGRAQNGLFYDAANDPAPGVTPARAPVPWNGFPRSIWQWFNGDADPAGPARAFAAAEVLAPLGTVSRPDGSTVTLLERQQDEYCEWHTHRDAQKRITRITFTCEGPEYYEEMAGIDLTLVGDLYREHVDPAVQDAHLVWDADMRSQGRVVFRRGSYNKWNRWNTRDGAMHLTHHANTLGAEINLAADATILFPVPEAPASSLPARLICCAGFGGVNRSSDPLIGAGVNKFARGGLCVTVANPVGLYMQDLAVGDLRDPDGAQIGAECFRIVRASPDKSLILRAEIAPPPGAAFTLDQCTFEGQPVTGGGLFARRITMVLFGLAKAIPGRSAIQDACGGKCCRKPETAGFLKLVTPQLNCDSLTDDNWNEDAPVTTAVSLVAPRESAFDDLQKKLAGGRGPIRRHRH